MCKKTIAAGIEATKMVIEYLQPDGSTKMFGLTTSGGPLSAATGQIQRGWHSRCYHVARKREARGDTLTGRVLSGLPTGYEIADMVLTRDDMKALGLTVEEARSRGTGSLTVQYQRLHDIASRVGKAVGDAAVLEAFKAEQHGGPYQHHHEFDLDTYQLREHLRYAHGLDITTVGTVSLVEAHCTLHALTYVNGEHT